MRAMKARSISLSVAAVALLLPALGAQDSGTTPNLPSAPSAVRQQQRAARQPSPPPPAKAQPTESTAPANTASPSSEAEPGIEISKADQPDTTKPEESPTATIRTTVNEVNVVFTVTDKHGHFVKNLKKTDFKVYDDKEPEVIRFFQNETNLPLEVGLLVDASNSIRDRFQFEQQSAIEFLNQTIRSRADKAMVIGFDETPEVTQDFTDDTAALAHGVRMLRPGGGTALFDALYFACRDKLLKEKHTGPVRKAIIVLSDGDDNQSHVTREEAIDMAQRAEVIVYTISTNIPGSGGRGDKILERIADATGGRSFEPFQLNDVADAFAQIQTELRSQYALSYHPAHFTADGQFHTIDIVALNHKNLKVRSRRGYYAPTPGQLNQ